MRALLLFAEDAVGAIEGWLRLDDGRVVARGARLDGLPEPEADEPLILLLVGSEVALRWVDLPPLTEAQAIAAARIAVADDSLAPVDTLHVAVGPLHGGARIVATVANDRMSAWLAWAAERNLDIDHIVPLPLLIAYGEGPAKVWTRTGRTLAHGRRLAFAIEPDLADTLLEGHDAEAIDDVRFELELPAALAAMPLDLRQGAFGRRAAWRSDAGWRRRIGRYAIAAAIMLALIPLARWGRIAWDGYQMRSEAGDVAQATLGLAGRPDDPHAALRRRLERLQGPGVGLIDGSAILFGAVRQTPNVELAGLDFDESGVLRARVRTTSSADLAELIRRIGSSGLVVETGGGVTGGTDIRLHRP